MRMRNSTRPGRRRTGPLPNASFPGIGLSDDEIRLITERLGREPTLVEAHAFDAQWSEHCSYKSSRVHLARLPTESPDVILGPGQDAGIVRLGEWEGETYGIVIAHESHNHPSQVVPFEGAATGIGGIVRDVLCMGARVIALADPLRFGPLDDPHSRYVAQGVVDGVAAYGNAIGVPTIAGDVYFHEGFRDNCLVNVVALGIVKESEIIHSCAPTGSAGWDIVLIGKATDRSGFGGAAFSSLVLDEKDAEANKSAVQVPDPFLKNVIMRASYRAFDAIRELGLTVGFKDLGAGGIMGCTAELAASGGFGARIALDRCPTSQADLPAAVIAVGETQERLAWVVPPSFTPRLLQIYNEEFSLPQIARGAQAAVIGTITSEKDYVLTHHGEEVMHVPIDFLTGGVKYERPFVLPTSELPSMDGEMPVSEAVKERQVLATLADERKRREGRSRYLALRSEIRRRLPFDRELALRILSHPDVCSRQPIYERYDAVVRGATSMPSGYADAGVVVPVPGSPLAVALGIGGNPRYATISQRMAGEHAVCEAVRNVVAVGARPVALTDCLNFGSPEDPSQMGEFVAAVDGIAHAAREFGLPFVSGNVSLYNLAASGRSIPGSPIVGCVGAIDDISKTVTPSLKYPLADDPGSGLWYIGPDQEEIGGSVLAELSGYRKSRLPDVDYGVERGAIAYLLEGIGAGLIDAVHDVSDGGLFVAAAEMAFAAKKRSGLGVALDIDYEIPGFRWGETVACFGEAGGYVVQGSRDAWALLRKHQLSAIWIGGCRLDGVFSLEVETIEGDGYDLKWTVEELYDAWFAPLQSFYEGVPM